MGLITLLNIGSSLDKIENVVDLVIKQGINQHATLKISAIIKKEHSDEYVKEANSGEIIEIFDVDEDENKTKLFVGVIEYVKIRNIATICYLDIGAVSASFLTDVKKESNSFQDIDMLYKTVIEKTLSRYSGECILNEKMREEKIQKFTMQYMETSWEYMVRLCSHFNFGIIPDIKYDKPKLFFGTPEGTDRGKLEKYNYYIEKDIRSFEISQKNHNPNLKELDKVNFFVDTNENFDIGDKINYQDVNLHIKSKEINLIQSSLRFIYMLSTENGLTQDRLYNEKIVGLSLRGKVLKPINDKIKTWLEIDDEQDENTAWEFPYTTPYTAEGNSGWYCIPEVDDTVFIYFPNREEHNGVGLNSIREIYGGSDKINDPDTKYFRTKNGKELKFAPDEILITCCNGINPETGEEKIIYIKLNDSNGIEIKSTEPININSDSNINFNAEKKIRLSAQNEIKLECKTSHILIDSAIDIAGKEVKIN
jgi:hypothetical protein